MAAEEAGQPREVWMKSRFLAFVLTIVNTKLKQTKTKASEIPCFSRWLFEA